MQALAQTLVSVVVPVFNAQDYLSDCIQSILNQQHKNLEIIMVNDGSTDNSVGVINQFIDKDPRIKILMQENAGQGQARNQGMALCQGEYLIFVDADDTIEPTLIHEMLSIAIKHQADLCSFEFFQQALRYKFEWIETQGIVHRFNTKAYNSSVCSKLFHKSLYRNKHLVFPKNRYYEDLIFCFETYYYAKKLVHHPKRYYHYINRKNSTTVNIKNKNIQDMQWILERLNEKIKKYGFQKKLKHRLKIFITYTLIDLLQCIYKMENSDKKKQIKKNFRKTFGKHSLFSPSLFGFKTYINYKLLLYFPAMHRILKRFL